MSSLKLKSSYKKTISLWIFVTFKQKTTKSHWFHPDIRWSINWSFEKNAHFFENFSKKFLYREKRLSLNMVLLKSYQLLYFLESKTNIRCSIRWSSFYARSSYKDTVLRSNESFCFSETTEYENHVTRRI